MTSKLQYAKNPQNIRITNPKTTPVFNKIFGVAKYPAPMAVEANVKIEPRIDPGFILLKVRSFHDLCETVVSKEFLSIALISKGTTFSSDTIIYIHNMKNAF